MGSSVLQRRDLRMGYRGWPPGLEPSVDQAEEQMRQNMQASASSPTF